MEVVAAVAKLFSFSPDEEEGVAFDVCRPNPCRPRPLPRLVGAVLAGLAVAVTAAWGRERLGAADVVLLAVDVPGNV